MYVKTEECVSNVQDVIQNNHSKMCADYFELEYGCYVDPNAYYIYCTANKYLATITTSYELHTKLMRDNTRARSFKLNKGIKTIVSAHSCPKCNKVDFSAIEVKLYETVETTEPLGLICFDCDEDAIVLHSQEVTVRDIGTSLTVGFTTDVKYKERR